jgi:hypothetical protein
MNRWFDVYGFRIGDEKSRKVAVLFNDIDRKQADGRSAFRTYAKVRKCSVWRWREAGWEPGRAIWRPTRFIGAPNSKRFSGFRRELFPARSAVFGLCLRRRQRAIALEVASDQNKKRITSIEFRFHHADGSLRWMEGRGQAVYAPTERRPKFTASELTSPNANAKSSTGGFCSNSAKKFVTANQPENTLAEITEMTKRLNDTARCPVYRNKRIGKSRQIRHEFAAAMSPVAGEYKISDYSRKRSTKSKAVALSSTTMPERDPRTADIYHKKLTSLTTSDLTFRFRFLPNGRWTAIFWVSDDKPRRWTAREIALLAAVGERAWLAAEKLRNEKALGTKPQTSANGDGRRQNLFVGIESGDAIKSEWSNNLERVIGFSLPPIPKSRFR